MKISIYNSNKQSPLFTWIKGGNLSLGLAVARKYVDTHINPKYEGRYQACIKLTKRYREMDQSSVFEWNHRQGNVRLALDTTDEFIRQKLGFDLIKQIQEAKP